MAMSRARSTPKLKFNRSIVASIDEPISTKELINRLKDLSNELSSIDQDNIDVSSLDNIKDQLVNKKLIKNNNLGVQSYVACCLSDILRIHAPDAPFTATQLTDIFKLFFNQFRHLNEQETNGCFPQYYYLLSKLSEVRSIILITDLPDSEKLIETIFEVFYGLANQPNFPLRLEPLICDILSEIISESDTVPVKVLKLILNKFLNDKGLPNTVSPSLNFSLSICNTNSDRMSRLITQFFSEMIYEGTRNEGYSAVFMENLGKLHKLSIEIWKHIPELLASVMGLIEDQLDAEDVSIRLMATATVSKIVAVHPSNINFSQTHSDTYTSWLKKTLDVSAIVRCKWVETTLPILLSGKNDIDDILNGLTKSLLDTDEKVRFVTCKTLAEIPSKLFLDKIASGTIMSTLGQLLREKHPEVRNEIIGLLGNLYNDCGDSERNNTLLNWIPDHILNLIYINDKSINAQVDLCLLERLLPFEDDSTRRVTRLLNVIAQLSEKSKTSFFAIIRRQQQISNVMIQLLKFSESYNGGNVIDGKSEPELRRKLDKVIDWLAQGLPTYYNSKICLDRFVKLNNRRFYKLIKLCLSADSDYETIKNSMKEFFNKINDSRTIKIENDISIPTIDMLNVFKLLLYRSSLVIANKSNIYSITEKTKEASDPLFDVSKELLECISVNVPGVLKSHIHELTQFILNYSENDGKGKYLATLKTVYQFLKQYDDFNEQLDIAFYDILSKIATNGSVSEAKYSIKIICLSRHKYSYTEDILNECYPLDSNRRGFATHLSVVSEFYLSVPSLVEDKFTDVTAFLIKDILLKNQRNDDEEDEEEWIEDQALDEGKYANCQQKLLALDLFANRLISAAPGATASEESELRVQTLAEPIFKLYMSLIGSGGEIVKSDVPTPKNYQSKLRVAAGLKLLEISKIVTYNKMLTPAIINRLLFLVQDERYQVRFEIVDKLQKLLYEDSISERFLPLLFFMAHEPEEKLKSNVKTWLRSSYAKKSTKDSRSLVYERSFVRLLHMICHHQEYIDLMNDYFESEEEETLVQAYSFSLEYICFYLEIIANQDNISLLYYFASRLKQYRDSLYPEQEFGELYASDKRNLKSSLLNLYRISELAQLAIKEVAHGRTWILSTYPGEFKLSADLFSSVKSQAEGQFIVHTVFIEDTITSRLTSLVKSKISSSGHRHAKRSSSHNPNGNTKKARSDRGDNKENIKVSKHKKKETKKLLEPLKASVPTRKSGRNTNKNINYAGDDMDEDDE